MTKDNLTRAALAIALTFTFAGRAAADAQPGDVITKDNADQVAALMSPGNLVLVKQGMQMKIVSPGRIEWPPGYRSATEKYSSQVSITPQGYLKNYVAGQPFPLLDANDPQLAAKIMWNFSFRPLYTDDIDMRYPEIATHGAGYAPDNPIGYFTVGHFAFYNNVGRIEVKPFPTDPDATKSGIRYRFGFFPFLEPASLRGYGLIRYRHIAPTIEDNIWAYDPASRRVRRESPRIMSDAIGAAPAFGAGGAGGGGGGQAGGGGFGAGGGGSAFVNNLDPDSYFGFSAKNEDFTYKFLGDKTMLASVHAVNSPATACALDSGRTICPENWEKRHLFVIEATAKPGRGFSIPRRVLYIDSEGWFITASDQYDREGQLWKTLAAFHTYRDRPVPDARVAIYPYKREFQLGLVDEDVQSGQASTLYMPGAHSPERECWYIDMGVVNNAFLVPQAMEHAGH